MKISLQTILFFALLNLCFSQKMKAQIQPDQDCTDKIYLKDGSIFVGKISSYSADGQIVMRTSSGLDLRIPKAGVKKIVQKCKDKKSREAREYSFQERGFFQHSRLGAMPGLSWAGENRVGYLVQHVAGFQFSRWAGAGLGIGADIFAPGSGDVVTYPVFGEIRGYFLPKNVTPYFSLAGGWAFVGKNFSENDFSNRVPTDWDGGWMAQGKLGYRLGNHFTLDAGVRFQRKKMHWTNRWQPGETGVDKILNQRLDLSLGIIF